MLKVCVMCDSILLKKTLESFLSGYLTPFNQCDVVITDKPLSIDRPFLLIDSAEDADIIKPFTRSTLLLYLDKYQKKIEGMRSLNTLLDEEQRSGLDTQTLEARLERLASDFIRKITTEIEAYYDQK